MSLAYDPDIAVAALTAADPRLAALIQRAGPFTLQPQKLHSPFDALLRAIVYQQLSGKAAATIHARLLACFPQARGPKPADIVAAPEALLRGAGMSRAKVAAVKDLAAKTLDGTVPTLGRLRKMDDAEVHARLVQVRGIGPWTIEMLQIFRLGRPDILPVSDLGVRKGYMLAYRKKELPTARHLIKHGERWRPYRSVASWYLWRAVDLAKNGTNLW